MRKLYSDDDLKDILAVSIQNETVDSRIAETLESISQGAYRKRVAGGEKKKQSEAARAKRRKGKGHSGWRKLVLGAGTAAAAIFMALLLCAANPALAANIPFLEDIFTRVQEVFRFGKLPEEETTKLYIEKMEDIQREEDGTAAKTADGSDPEAEKEDDSYRAQSQGITITFTEYYASNQAVFLGVCIENDEEFPTFATMGDADYQLVQVSTREEYSFRNTGISGFRNIEGRLEDPYTFVGVMRIDYDTIDVDTSRYDAACDEAEKNGEELPELNAENQDDYLDYYEVPEEFEMQMRIERLQGYSLDLMEVEEGSKYTVMNGTKFMVRGEWEYPAVTIQKSDRDVRTIQVNEVNEAGIGVEKIEISPVELTLHIVEPADRPVYGVALDKNGKMLTGGSSNAYELTTVGRDISTVYIYICDHDEYMDEIWGLEEEEKLQSMLEEKALFQTEIVTKE